MHSVTGFGQEKELSQEQRFQKILFVLKKRGTVSVNELSSMFGVSKVTVRGDLGELERQGLVIRKYGGAALVPETPAFPPDSGSMQAKAVRKSGAGMPGLESRAIARAAFQLVREGDVVFLDGSAESRLLAILVARMHNVVILTTSLVIAYKISRICDLPVYLSGGKVDRSGMTVSGASGSTSFSDFFITRAFFGAGGASSDAGFMDSSPEEAAVKRIVVQKAGEAIVLLLSSRWGTHSLAPFAALATVDVVVTDVDASAGMTESLRREGVRVLKSDRSREDPDVYRTFAEYRACARDMIPYISSPGKGKRIAFANGNRSEPFCASVERGFLVQTALAGFRAEDILVLDNAYDPETAVKNARAVIEWKADVLVDFNTDSRSNHLVGDLCRKSGLPVLALEGQIPSAPYAGANNWRAGTLAGDFATVRIREKFGGFENVDGVILLQLSSGGEAILLRTEGFAASLEAAFGENAEAKVIRVEGGNEYGSANLAMLSILGTLSASGRYVLTSVNSESMQGALDALAGNELWDAGRFVSVSHGCDELGTAQVQGGAVDGAVDYHPERYGAHIVPMACALMQGQPVPPYEYVDVAVVTSSGYRGDV